MKPQRKHKREENVSMYYLELLKENSFSYLYEPEETKNIDKFVNEYSQQKEVEKTKKPK